MTLSQASKETGVLHHVLRGYVKTGIIPSVTINKHYYIHRDFIKEYHDQIKELTGSNTLLAENLKVWRKLTEEYQQKIQELREDLLLISRSGHLLSTKKLFDAIIKSGGFSEEEKQVLGFLVEAKGFNEIAKELGVSNQLARQIYHRTIRKMQHMTNIAELTKENAILKSELKKKNVLIDILYQENNNYRTGKITSKMTDDYIFSMRFLLRKKIMPSNLSKRTYNALQKANIYTLGDIVRMSKKQVQKIRGIRVKCSEEIFRYIEKEGLFMEFDVDGIEKAYKLIYG